MTVENLRGSVDGLRRMAASLRITGETGEQTLLLAIINTLSDFTEAMDPKAEPADIPGKQHNILTSQCPTCGETISLDVSNLHGGEPIECNNCHEIIGVISGSLYEN